MKIVFLGSPEFAIESLKAILESKHEVLAVVTQPDSEADRGHKLKPCPVKVFAEKNGLKVYCFDKISRDGVGELKALKPDIMVTCAYGQILSQEVIDIPKFGIINVHGSLLPKYRGAAPIQSCIINGETETGITIMQTEAGLDSGDILNFESTPIYDGETAGELSERLSVIGARLLIKTLDQFETGTVSRTKQHHNEATFTTKITKVGATINFNKTATQIVNLIRGCNPNPVARAVLDNDQIKVYNATERKDIVVPEGAVAGEIIAPTSAKNGVFVACGFGVIELLRVQFPNGKECDAKSLVAGRKLTEGMTFKEFAK